MQIVLVRRICGFIRFEGVFRSDSSSWVLLRTCLLKNGVVVDSQECFLSRFIRDKSFVESGACVLFRFMFSGCVLLF